MEHLSKLISAGNSKLPSTTAIFNMGTAKDCPSLKLGLCQAFVNGKCVCYARKAEAGMWPTVTPYRKRQEQYWKSVKADQFVSEFIAFNARKRNKFTALRLNESGDFWTQACINKAEEIARLLNKYKILVYGYTSRRDLDFSKCKKIKLLGSGFKKRGLSGIFLMVNDIKKDKPSHFGICLGNCRICSRCLRGLNTVVKKH